MGFGLLQGLGSGFLRAADIWSQVPEQQRRRAEDARRQEAAAREAEEHGWRGQTHKQQTRLNEQAITQNEESLTDTREARAERQRTQRVARYQRGFEADPTRVIPDAERAAIIADLGEGAINPNGTLNEGVFYNRKERAETKGAEIAANTAEKEYGLNWEGPKPMAPARAQAALDKDLSGIAADRARIAEANVNIETANAQLPLIKARAALDSQPGALAEDAVKEHRANFLEARKSYHYLLRYTRSDPDSESGVNDVYVKEAKREMESMAEALTDAWARAYENAALNAGDKSYDPAKVRRTVNAAGAAKGAAKTLADGYLQMLIGNSEPPEDDGTGTPAPGAQAAGKPMGFKDAMNWQPGTPKGATPAAPAGSAREAVARAYHGG